MKRGIGAILGLFALGVGWALASRHFHIEGTDFMLGTGLLAAGVFAAAWALVPENATDHGGTVAGSTTHEEQARGVKR